MAQAQLVNLLSAGVRLGVGVAINNGRENRDMQSDASIVPVRYHGLEYPQKRTAAKKLKGPGADQIAYQEELLQKCQAALTADSTTALGNAELWEILQGSRDVIALKRPSWNTEAYADEAAFYEAETLRRQRAKQLAATR